MECLLCLEIDKDVTECISVNSNSWDELKIQSIIEKHLWPTLLLKTESQWLCSTCWLILHEFHKFYIRVERAHENLLKIEPDPAVIADTEDGKPKDCLADNLLEPEIILAHNLPIVKQEYDESDDDDDGDTINGEDNIPLIHMRKMEKISARDPTSNSEDLVDDPLNKIENIPANGPINESEVLMEDPLNKTAKPKSKVPKRRKPKNVLIESPKLAKTTKTRRKSKDVSNTTFKKDPDDNINNSSGTVSGSLIFPDNESLGFDRLYHETKVAVNEYDTFLAEYFKLNCDLCQKHCANFTELQNHFDEVHEIRGYIICCGNKYISRSLLVDHISFHLNPEYFKCPHCSEIPTLRKDFKAHMKTHNDELHSCDICKKTFQNKYFLSTHKRIHVPEEERKFLCTVCDKSFATEPMLTYHQNAVHLKAYRKLCDICGATFRDVESLKRHLGKHEGFTAPPPLSCEVCGRLCANKRNLKIHMNSQHPVEKKDFICHVCSKRSPNAKALRQHVRVNHETGFIHKCSICEKAFKRAENLKSHMNIHTGTDLYHCAWCPKTFNANSSMHLHRKTAHPREWEEERRRKYSGNLPPNYKPPPTKDNLNNFPLQYNF